ncbi:hypothetical protein GHT06_009718 [Daphnia sinensis]|uniref:Uncharacterized protein n=1 Tax=Daphnia sinensis TaxID=1820382 RepID=A0AAD5Q3Y1_9CRUS|nr:hypothetical protein GHT06_009718 [Daphnia sinensis]
MVPCNSCNAGIITAGIAVVMTIASVSGQLFNCESDCSRNGCRPPNNLPITVTFVLTRNIGESCDIASSCFPFNTTLLFVCRDQITHQFAPVFGKTRRQHCLWAPPVPIGPNIFVQIDGQNVSTADSNVNAVRYYSEGTKATYKCMYPKFLGDKEVQQTWRCTKEEEKNKWNPLSRPIYSWKLIKLNAQELFCDSPLDMADNTEEQSTTTKTTNQQQTTRSNIIIGICGAVAFVLIALLLGVCYRNRLLFGKRYDDNARFVSQRSLAPIIEEQTKCYQSNQYANIIPIKVNSETIYTEVETGKVGHDDKIDAKVKYTVRDDQLQTVYAEIHHPK